ncbi:PHD finger-containing protein 1 [Cardamine amara subsp. amara]|uniref:PHD finger-containing protein 1 n=1 Tax=Cardamine amara subsp. amara TaxID=228776 RepID=A0ABD0ZW40_CARAN
MDTVCQTCGDIGFEEWLLYCDSCKIKAIHRYCVGIVPVPITEYVTWICEDCDGSDSDSNCQEIDQTAKLGNVVKKCDKKKNNNNNHTFPVLAEDHGLQDATNAEAMEVSSSPIKETVKESKRRESSYSGKCHELTGLVRNGASILEAGDSSSFPDYNSCTSKMSESSSVRKEVDQTDKLHMSKKKKKKKMNKEKKNNKMSSNHTPPVLAFEDHGVQDTTSVEPVKMSSPRIKQTMKESKRRESPASGKPSEVTGLVGNGESVSVVEKLSTVPDHSSCTRKINDSGSDDKEVDQTAKFGRISKKSGKKKKKKKKNKTSSNPSLLVLAVEENGLQDVANVEPVKLFSSPINETGKESKSRESSDSRKSHGLTGIERNGASVMEAGNSSNMPDDNSCTSKKRKTSSGNTPVTNENRQLALAESNMPQTPAGFTSEHYRAQPIKKPIWRGSISVKGGNICSIDRIVAHVSSLACVRVHETASSLHTRLSAEMLPRLAIWPKSFLKNTGPKDESIALYLFPSSESNDEKVFHSLVLEMKKNDSAMRCVLDDAELLLFTSYMLPMDSWTFNSKEYLWGVFRPRQTSRH